MMSFRIALLLLVARGAFAAPATAPASKPAAAPWVTRVLHEPTQPKSNQPVNISASLAADVTNVRLAYQVLDPGQYVELKDPAYEKDWTPLDMKPGATAKGRTAYSVTLPAELQKHRRLIRYRIIAKDASGKPLLSPQFPAAPAEPGRPARAESPSNYAYFVYDGVPPWTGAIHLASKDPKRNTPATFAPEALTRAQVYHLIAKRTSVENVTWNEPQGGREYRYTGTLVTPGGVAHDHVRFRARGGVWRFSMGKNMWKLDLAPGDRAAQRDDFGRPYKGGVTKLNLGAAIQQGDTGRRGEQGMYESVGLALFNLAGVEAPRTHWVHWRIVDDAEESPKDQYQGDFWGLYLAIENEDGRFLKNHGLPDGNLYKMANGTGELNHDGEGQPTDKSDLNAFQAAYHQADQPEAWWRDNLDLPCYYSYRAIVECIHHYDIGEGKNYDFYRNPETKRWQTIPWDLDLSWADHVYGNANEPFSQRVLIKPVFQREYQNRLREIRDLLFNAEQAGALIDEYAAVLTDPGKEKTSILEADRRKWDYHPALAIGGKAGQGRFYRATPTRDFAGIVKLMKEYVETRGAWVDQTLLNDPEIPTTPEVTYSGEKAFPAKGLRFTPSVVYQGQHPFAAAQWRIGEITPTNVPPTQPRTPRRYEITATWQSEELPKLEPITLPADAAKAGKTYRARVRVKDATGRWSHWSAAVEFAAS